VPESTANLRVKWDFLPDWEARTSLKYVGSRFANNANTVELPAYTAVDFGVRWSATDNIALDLRVDNLFDELYPIVAHSANANQWFLAAPRSVTATLDVTF
ncbi:MAG: TonB-dependent receptor, partial [Oxalobacteraceae bacterium]